MKCLTLLGCLFLVLGLVATEPDPRPFPRTADGYAYPDPEIPLRFPYDHGDHPAFAIEWWYITGHLRAPESGDRPFAFQITFFRYSAPPDESADGSADNPMFGTRTIFLAHAALMDIPREAFFHQEKLNRLGWNASSQTGTLDMANGSWSLVAEDYNADGDPDPFHFRGGIHSDVDLQLTFRPAKKRILFGDRGVSRKGASPESASYYITFPRLDVEGRIRVEGTPYTVEGQAWMDHEISSNQLEDDQEGWDWVQMQLFDGTEIMAYRLRRKDQSTAPYSFCNWIDEGGRIHEVKADQFQWLHGRPWTSEVTGATYPIGPQLIATHPETGKQHTYRIVPRVDSSEMPGDLGGISYWEGAVDIYDEDDQHLGVGFLELTGYAQDLSERL